MEIKLKTAHGTSCAVELSVGQQYVIFGSRNPKTGEISTAQCAGSFAVTPRNQAWVNAVSAAMQSKLGFVHGSLARSEIWRYASDPSQILSGITIGLSSGARNLTSTTDLNGSFLTENVPPGAYQIAASFSAQPFVFTSGPWHPIVGEIEVPSQGCVELTGALPRNINFRGVALDPEGKPVTSTEVLAIPRDENSFNRRRRFAARTNAAGRFQLADMGPGDYRLLLLPPPNAKSAKLRSTYFPGTLNSAEAQLFTVADPAQGPAAPIELEFRALSAPNLVTVHFSIPDLRFDGDYYSILLKLEHNPSNLFQQAIPIRCTKSPSCEVDLPEGEGFGIVNTSSIEHTSPRQYTARPGLTVDLRRGR